MHLRSSQDLEVEAAGAAEAINMSSHIEAIGPLPGDGNRELPGNQNALIRLERRTWVAYQRAP